MNAEGPATPRATYRIFAVRYAHRETTYADVFFGDHSDQPIGMDYFVWVVMDGSRSLVVDLGFTEAVGTRRGRQMLRPVERGLAELGIDVERVEDVVITHFHYDHTGNHALFPRATFHVQAEEMAFYTGPDAPRPAFRRSVEVEDVVALVRASYEGRVAFVEGEREIWPGVRLHRVGGHTAANQIVSVATERGTAVITSDAAHYYRNLEENIPFPTLHDIPRVYRAFDQVRALAGSPELILPGHDPLVLERLKRVGEGIVEL